MVGWPQLNLLYVNKYFGGVSDTEEKTSPCYIFMVITEFLL